MSSIFTEDGLEVILSDDLAEKVAKSLRERERVELHRAEQQALMRLEARAVQKEAQGEGQFGVVLIDVDDTAWRELVELLMPNQEAQWAGYRAQGLKPIARGVVPRDTLIEILSKTTTIPATTLPARVFTVVFAEGGASVFEAL